MTDVQMLKISGGEHIITHDRAGAYRVHSGNALIYIVPWINERAGRRAFLYEAKPGEVIPALCFKDYEYTEWRLCLVAADSAEFGVISGGCTNILHERFAAKAGIRSYSTEGFENSLVNFYKMTIVAEDALIHKTAQERKTTAENTLRLIHNVFSKNRLKIVEKRAEYPLYSAAARICENNGIRIAPLAKILEACPNGFTIRDIARVSHFPCREVLLEQNWHRTDSGALLVFDADGDPAACLPKGQNRYAAYNADSGKSAAVTDAFAQSVNPKAFAIYRPFPNQALGIKDLLRFCLKSVNKSDVVQICVFTAVSTLIGLLLPMLNQLLYDKLIPVGYTNAVIQLGFVIGSVMVGNVFFAVAKGIASFRVVSRIEGDLQCALLDRLFNLPERFYRKYESADLAQRLSGLAGASSSVVASVLTTFLAALLSLVYFVQMLGYSGKLSAAAFVMLAVYAALSWLTARERSKYQEQIQTIHGKSSSVLYQLINGIAKIRMSGAEDRALFEYLKLFVKTRELGAKEGFIANLGGVLAVVAEGVFSIVLYWLLVNSGTAITVGQFIAFTSAFGFFSAAFLQVFSQAAELKLMKPLYERGKPILTAMPEFDEAKELPGELSGELEVASVTFAYEPDAPPVLDNVSLHVQAGEYVGIVGPSGCGKSTLLKLLLGFETPPTGKIFYDGRDIESLDKRELRKKLGVVLQDGKLISGSIFDNITITAPAADLDDVKRVIRGVGLEKDIADMPMGLHTILSEDCGTISGGQQQRILIARAIIGGPKLIFFDEATSALDNVTQAAVCATLDALPATRLVIAHRLSTIVQCDRIIVMNNGKIQEQGTYAELMASGGLFAELASRQIS
ncbi:MAG: NHLP bacteriocin export ABC transporter permease/ATPase subunit [Peptococcaceae bacterium]|jgi:ATP-binding cassette subfamily C protein|nr:NHLP bacteriocin export ABC transporter permease/ATPase subunit [Peptococcaceae bacterium]